jgi:phage shock protein A
VNATFDRTAEKQTDQMECPALSWFETVERRLDRAEQLASVETVEQARAAVDAAGGIDAARELAATIRTDRETLTQLEQRRSEVSDRIEHVEIPLDTLEQIT